MNFKEFLEQGTQGHGPNASGARGMNPTGLVKPQMRAVEPVAPYIDTSELKGVKARVADNNKNKNKFNVFNGLLVPRLPSIYPKGVRKKK